ncbi:MAG: hypothetical protein AAB437_05205 [Patescibacteria group bacterium]
MNDNYFERFNLLNDGEQPDILSIPNTPKSANVLFIGEFKQNPSLKNFTYELIQNGLGYLSNLLGEGFDYLSKNWVIKSHKGKDVHMCEGIVMSLSVPRLQKAQELFTKGHSDLLRLEQSQIIHELLHNITDLETIPMFAEILYLIDKGDIKRISEIKELSTSGKLGKNHDQGLNEIKKIWGGVEDIFEVLKIENIEMLKSKFKDYFLEYCKEE